MHSAEVTITKRNTVKNIGINESIPKKNTQSTSYKTNFTVLELNRYSDKFKEVLNDRLSVNSELLDEDDIRTQTPIKLDLSLYESIVNAMHLITEHESIVRTIDIAHDKRVWTLQKIINLIDPELREYINKPMSIFDKRQIKIICNICRKLNIHLVIYNVICVDTSYNIDLEDNIKLEKRILDIKPRYTTVNTDSSVSGYGSRLNPRKISLAYWGKLNTKTNIFGENLHNFHYKEAFTLICSETDHSPNMIDLTQNYVLHNLCYQQKRYRYHNYVYNDYKELREIAVSVAEFVLDEKIGDQTKEIHMCNSLSIELYDYKQRVRDRIQESYNNNCYEILRFDKKIQELENNIIGYESLSDTLSNMITMELGNCRIFKSNIQFVGTSTKNNTNIESIGYQRPEIIDSTIELIDIVETFVEDLVKKIGEFKEKIIKYREEITKLQLMKVMKESSQRKLETELRRLNKP